MPNVFRSEEMALCHLFLQNEIAYECISELGELGLCQFRDLNENVNAYQRRFVTEIRRCDEMERILTHFRQLLDERNKDHPFPLKLNDMDDSIPAPSPTSISDLESTLSQLSRNLTEVTKNETQLKRTKGELNEVQIVLRRFQGLLEANFTRSRTDSNVTSDSAVLDLGSNLDFIAGTLIREKVPTFERLVWRTCRGNVFVHQVSIDQPVYDATMDSEVLKNVVVIVFQGSGLREKINRICSAFHINTYPCPREAEERRSMSIGVMTRLDELERVMSGTSRHKDQLLEKVAAELPSWTVKVRKIKAIFHILNQFKDDITTKCLVGEVWCPEIDLETINISLQRGLARSGSQLAPILNRITTKDTPPTYFKLNKVNRAFQNIVHAYGVASYREVNPGLFTVITFPFLFGVMFGDAGHGTIMALFALWMVLREKPLGEMKGGGEIWRMCFGGRYVILLMGLFSVYTGFIYNDAFSLSMNIFGSSWIPHYDLDTLSNHTDIQMGGDKNESIFQGYPYAMGIDPAWQLSLNKINFTNSIKMKMSILLGVMQMFFGLCLSLCNYIHKRDWWAVLYAFIPEAIFLMAIFGNLCILFFYKWIHYTPEMSASAPSLLVGLINMFMFKYTPDDPLQYNHPVYALQQGVQTTLVVLLALCIPWMLLMKPMKIIYDRKKRSRGARYNSLEEQTEDPEANLSGSNSDVSAPSEDGEEESSTSDIMVYQAIHTIEYCLGCISNTASYLRLWALSLAHAQLSEVLWTMVFRMGLSINGYFGAVMLFVVFTVWAALTIAILLLMEGLSAFLHALRLHWVEFQNKFYQGGGILFEPFSFKSYLVEDEVE